MGGLHIQVDWLPLFFSKTKTIWMEAKDMIGTLIQSEKAFCNLSSFLLFFL